MAWDIEFTDEFDEWWQSLTTEQQTAVAARVALLAERGPNLRRPYAGEIKGSRNDPRMKELVVERDGALRVLFIFDPRSTAILLLGGDKTGDWNAWYRTAIPTADDLYDIYLGELHDEGLI